jgi:hypothetical protein
MSAIALQPIDSTRQMSSNPFPPTPESVEAELAREFSESIDVAPLDGFGRSSVSGVVATVFGSTGFIGRYVVNRLGMWFRSSVLSVVLVLCWSRTLFCWCVSPTDSCSSFVSRCCGCYGWLLWLVGWLVIQL